MLGVVMRPLISHGDRTKKNSPNPLECPPSLVHNQYQQPSIERKLSEGSETTASLMFGDFSQQQNHSDRASPFSDSKAQQMPIQQNNQDVNVMNLQEQLLSSLASQIMTQRSRMLNYNLHNNNQQFLGANMGEESSQGMALGSHHGMLALASNTKTNNGNNQDGLQQQACTRVPCQARGMSTDHNALVSHLQL